MNIQRKQIYIWRVRILSYWIYKESNSSDGYIRFMKKLVKVQYGEILRDGERLLAVVMKQVVEEHGHL